jgi:hypothetical protein
LEADRVCVIIDANLVSQVFRENPNKDFASVLDWLRNPKKKGQLVYGGRLAKEMSEVRRTRGYLAQLRRIGRAREFTDDDLTSEELLISRTGLCRSNDPHVVALARVSGARTLCSLDGALGHDFKNLRLISKPKGCIYKNATHSDLLRHTSSCHQGRKG